MADDTILVGQSVPSALSRGAEGSTKRRRGDRYGTPYFMPLGAKMDAYAAEGSYYSGRNATALTGIVLKIITAFAAVSPCLLLKNADTVAQGNAGRSIFLDFIRLTFTVAPASASALHLYGFVDDVARYTSGGTLISPTSNNPLESADAGDLCYVGDIVAAAVGANIRPVLGPLCARAQIPVIKDEILLTFGHGMIGGASHGVITSAQRDVIPCQPVIVPPGCSFLLHPAMPLNASTAGEVEVEVAYIKR